MVELVFDSIYLHSAIEMINGVYMDRLFMAGMIESLVCWYVNVYSWYWYC